MVFRFTRLEELMDPNGLAGVREPEFELSG